MKRPAKAIRARCLECAETYREVKHCSFVDCPLWHWRLGRNAYRGKVKPEGYHDARRTIRLYCLWCCKDQPAEVRQCPAQDCALWPYRLGRGVSEKACLQGEAAARSADGMVKAADTRVGAESAP